MAHPGMSSFVLRPGGGRQRVARVVTEIVKMKALTR